MSKQGRGGDEEENGEKQSAHLVRFLFMQYVTLVILSEAKDLASKDGRARRGPSPSAQDDNICL
jgi:hypothetical protein